MIQAIPLSHRLSPAPSLRMGVSGMSIIPMPPSSSDWLPPPESVYRFSVEKYEEMVASGVFTKSDRFHLINGILVVKMSEYPPHAAVSDATRLPIESILPAGWYIRPDKPLRIPNRSSVPEPDLVVTRGRPQDYFHRHPDPADVALVVEVADSRLREARDLIAVYGGGGVPVYWIVNMVDRQVEIYTGPNPIGYQSLIVVTPGQDAAVVIAGREVGRIAVADLFP
jgi:Uma2 family endonuclease